MWYLYIVKCRDDSLYTGISTDITRRISEHNGKIGARSLFGKLPVVLVYQERHLNQKDAARREREIKGWKREKKLTLIETSCIETSCIETSCIETSCIETGFTLSKQSLRRAR